LHIQLRVVTLPSGKQVKVMAPRVYAMTSTNNSASVHAGAV